MSAGTLRRQWGMMLLLAVLLAQVSSTTRSVQGPAQSSVDRSESVYTREHIGRLGKKCRVLAVPTLRGMRGGGSEISHMDCPGCGQPVRLLEQFTAATFGGGSNLRRSHRGPLHILSADSLALLHMHPHAHARTRTITHTHTHTHTQPYSVKID